MEDFNQEHYERGGYEDEYYREKYQIIQNITDVRC